MFVSLPLTQLNLTPAPRCVQNVMYTVGVMSKAGSAAAGTEGEAAVEAASDPEEAGSDTPPAAQSDAPPAAPAAPAPIITIEVGLQVQWAAVL